jgi:hypothetical protein
MKESFSSDSPQFSSIALNNQGVINFKTTTGGNFQVVSFTNGNDSVFGGGSGDSDTFIYSSGTGDIVFHPQGTGVVMSEHGFKVGAYVGVFDTTSGSDTGYGISALAAGNRGLFLSRDSGAGGKSWIFGDGAADAAAGTFAICNASDTTTPVILFTAAGIGFYGTTPIAKPTVTGSRGANAALASLMTALANLGLVVNSTS